ncbi:NAD(P)-binding domain-containing protein [Streptomyces sp. NPDC057695]|uniref:NAD(P)-binding domain-containing protein n=1 Tax=Streptomyces sp. NPDC057695 TaxID=3346217 RepID=UPI003695B8B4
MPKPSASPYDLVVVGAGPYGLSAAAHAAAHGLHLRVLGRPMESWHAMPPGMFLKSEPWASHLSDPAGAYGLDAFAAARGVRAEHGVPLPVDLFAAYGDWFARRAVPPVDGRLVDSVAPGADGFVLRTEDGEPLRARTVALAVGVLPFAEIPGPLRGLPRRYVTHSSHHGRLDRFTGLDVTVVGAGQAALETAVLLVEQGAAAVRIVARADRLRWNTPPPALDRGSWPTVRAPHTGLGCGWRNKVYADAPGAFRRLPAATRERIFASALGPAGAWWLRERFAAVGDVRLGQRITSATVTGEGRLRLAVSGPEGAAVLETDHVVAATGFTPSLDRAEVLSPGLRGALRRVGAGGAPEVGALFESSWPGLFLAGLLTAPSYGPSMRFVLGAEYTAGRLVRGVRRRLRAGARGGAAGRPRTEGRAQVSA